MANLQKHPFFKISRYMIERCMKDEQEEKKKYRNNKIFSSDIIEIFKSIVKFI